MPDATRTEQIKNDSSKEKRIEKELKRITEIFKEADGNQKAIAKPLIQNAAFMKVTLEDLQETINAEGVIDEYQNGANQRGIKQSATLQSYNSLIKNYTSVIKALSAIVPPEKKDDASSNWSGWMEAELERREDERLLKEYKREEARCEAEGLPPLPSFPLWRDLQKAETEEERQEIEAMYRMDFEQLHSLLEPMEH